MTLEPTHQYDDIIDLPHHQSRTHPHMPRRNRAAQFMPFAALSGYDEIITETARTTQARVELDIDEQAALDRRLRNLLVQMKRSGEHPYVTFTVFRPDKHKDGGSYVTVEGRIRRFDDTQRLIIMEDGTAVSLSDVIAVDGADNTDNAGNKDVDIDL